MTDATSAHQHSLPMSSDALLDQLHLQGITFQYYEHIPLRTVEDAKTVQGKVIPDAAGNIHLKNLYLRNKKKQNYLVVLEQDRDVDLKWLGESIGAGRVSFGSAERLMEHLGVRPGAVSPLAMINGAAMNVMLFVDIAVRDAKLVNMHPLVNDRTVAMSTGDLLKTLNLWGVLVHWLEFD